MLSWAKPLAGLAVVALLAVALADRGARPDRSEAAGDATSAAETDDEGTQPAPEPEPALEPEPLADDAWPVDFPGTTDTTLVFDDGTDGAVAVDLDTGLTARIRLPQRAGDARYRIWRLGDEHVAVGWGEISVVRFPAAPDALEERRLPDATTFVPAAEPEQLWLIDHDSGRADRSVEVTWTLVNIDGRQVSSIRPGDEPNDLEALRGIPGGLVARTDFGELIAYDLDGNVQRTYLGESAVHLLDVTASEMLWCGDPCDALHIADGRSALAGDTATTRTVGGHGDVRAFDAEATWLSPDGTRIVTAAMVNVGDGAVDRELRVYDANDGGILASSSLPLGRMHGAWHPDGRSFYFTSAWPDAAEAPQLLGRWSIGGGIAMFEVGPHLRELGQFVVLESDAAPRLPS